MATKLWNNFGLGINRSGLQAPSGSVESISNMLPFAGYAEVAKGKTALNFAIGNTTLTTGWTALGRVGLQNLGKNNGIVSNIRTIGSLSYLFPLWDRRSGGYPAASEVFTGYKDDVFFSSVLPPNTSVTAVEEVDKLIRWGGYVAFNSMAVTARNTAITSSTNTSPIVVTTPTHALTTGERLTISGHDQVGANGTWTVTVLSPTTFSLDLSTGTGVGTNVGSYVPYTLWQLYGSGTLGTVTGFSLANSTLAPGYRMFYGTQSGGVYTWAGSTIIRTIESPMTDAGGIYVKTDAIASPGTYNLFCIVNTDPVGIPTPTLGPHRGVLSAGGSLAAGNYQWCYRYVSASLGIVGNPSPPSGVLTVTGGSGNYTTIITTQYTEADKPPYWADTIEIYRRFNSGAGYGLWYLVKSQLVTTVVGGAESVQNFQPAWTDDGSVSTTGATTLADADYWNDRPSTLFNCRVFNSRMYAVKGSAQNTLKFSTMQTMDAWPVDIVDAQTTTAALKWQGGEVIVGDAMPIQALVPEGGSWSNTGQQGDNLLIMKRNRSWRWYGTTWDDFALNDAFSLGTRDGKSVVNCGGIVCFMGSEHGMWVQSGGMHPEPFTKTLWPNGYQANTLGLVYPDPPPIADLHWGAFWGHYYILSVNQEQQTYFFDIDKGFAPTKVDFAPCFSQFYDSVERLLSAGFTTSAVGTIATIVPAFSFDKTNGTVCSIKSQPEILPSANVMSLTGAKTLKNFWVYAKNTSGVQQTMTLRLYLDGDTDFTSAVNMTVTIPTSATRNYHCILVRVPALFQPTVFQWSLDGTVYAGVTIEWVLCQYEDLTPKTQI